MRRRGIVNGEWAMVNREGFALPIHYCPLPIHQKATNLISRILFLNHHLSGPGITAVILLPTLDRAAQLSVDSGEPPSNDPIHGITAPKVYPCSVLPRKTVSFYLTFSPFPRQGVVVIFCGTFSSRQRREPALNRWVALRCPDFPSRLRRDDGSGL